MSGLILKDLLILKKQLKIWGILLAFYFLFGIMTDNASMMGAITILVCLTLPINCLAYEERCKWNSYALSLPVSRAKLVFEKYLLSLILMAVSTIIVIPLNILTIRIIRKTLTLEDYGEALGTPFIIGMIGIFFLSLLLPVMYKYGVEKGRLVMFAIMAAVMLISFGSAFLLKKQGTPLELDAFVEVQLQNPLGIVLICTLAMAVLYGVSYFITVSIVKKKEY